MQLEIGLFFGDWGVHEKATEYFSRSYKAKVTLGDTYYQLKNRGEAQTYYQLLLNLHRSKEDKHELVDVLERLGEIHDNSGEREKALEYELQALSLKKEMRVTKGMATSYNKIGNLYKNLNDNDRALEFYK